MEPHHQRAQLLISQNRFDLAEQELGSILVKNPQDAIAHMLMTICYKHTKRYREATQSAEQAISLDPENHHCHLIMASVLLMRDRYDEAERAALESLRLNPYEEDTYGLLSQVKYLQKEWESSLEYAEKGLEVDPDHAGCQNFRSLALERLGRHEVAVAAAEEGLARNPDDSSSHATHGWALLNQGKHKQAQESFREALRLDPTNEFAKQGMISALNANHLLYRWIFKWYSLMGRMSGNVQWLIILGLFFGQQIIGSLAESVPVLKPFVLPLIFIYMAFAITTWIANPLFNTFLRFSRYGKYLLDDRQIMASNVMAGMFAFGLLLGALLALAIPGARLNGFMLGGGYGLLMLLPISATFRCDAGYPLIVMSTVSLALAGLGLLAIGSLFVVPTIFSMLLPVFIYGNVGAQFLGIYLASVNVEN